MSSVRPASTSGHDRSRKRAYHLHRRDGQPFAFAGLWDRWHGPAGDLLTCCILTTNANEVVRPIHDRMPVLLSPADFGAWLDPTAAATGLQPLFRPPRPDELEAVAVSTLVNSPKNEGPEVLRPIEPI